MRRTFLAVLGLTLMATSAVAADLGPSAMPVKAPVMAAPAPIYNWTGFYIGAHVGGGWSNKDWDHCHGAAGCGFEPTSFDPSGFLGGVQAGFNYQVGQWLLGVEGQVSWTDMKGDAAIWPGATVYSQIDMVASLAGRLGITFDRALLYAKGGVAWVSEDHWATVSGLGTDSTFQSGSTRTGWMVGVGIEYAFWSNWSAKLEYNFMDFGNDVHRLTWIGAGFGDDFRIGQQVQVVKFGINYRFGGFGPVAARY